MSKNIEDCTEEELTAALELKQVRDRIDRLRRDMINVVHFHAPDLIRSMEILEERKAALRSQLATTR